MEANLQLFWLRESGCDTGTRVRVEDLEPEIRERVTALAGAGGEISLRLPFLDRREWRRRKEILSGLRLERRGSEIAPQLEPAEAVRDLAATLVFTHPAWLNAPEEIDLLYFPVWQKVSLALQRSLRNWIAEEYFRDLQRFEDRESAYPMLMYAAARLWYGHPRTEFTYDLSDYPGCRETLIESWRMTGRRLQELMAQSERRLHEAGRQALARRYAPVWHKDVMAAVRKKPNSFVELLAAESAIINALIDLGTGRSVAAVNRFTRIASRNLRNVHGLDLRPLGIRVLEQSTATLESNPQERGDITSNCSPAGSL